MISQLGLEILFSYHSGKPRRARKTSACNTGRRIIWNPIIDASSRPAQDIASVSTPRKYLYGSERQAVRARTLLYYRIAFSRSHGRHSEYAASPSEQFTPFVLFLTAMTHIFPVFARGFVFYCQPFTDIMRLRERKCNCAMHVTQPNCSRSLIARSTEHATLSYLSSRFLSCCAVPYMSTKTYLYVEAIISIPESISAARFTYTRRRK